MRFLQPEPRRTVPEPQIPAPDPREPPVPETRTPDPDPRIGTRDRPCLAGLSAVARRAEVEAAFFRAAKPRGRSEGGFFPTGAQ